MLGLALLFLFNFLGLLLHDYAHIPLPENVLGMLLLLAALSARLVKLEWVEEAADFLLHHMMLFFAPVIVAVIPLWQVLQDNLAPAVGGLILSTLATLAATAWAAQWLSPRAAGKVKVEATHAP